MRIRQPENLRDIIQLRSMVRLPAWLSLQDLMNSTVPFTKRDNSESCG